MPADLRIRQINTDPDHPEGGQVIRFFVEAVNVGDEGTGPFVVRFELDNHETFDQTLDNLAPGESEWLYWPHDGLAQGAHHIAVHLDAERTVHETEENKNYMVRQFEVREIEFAPQDARYGEEDYDANKMANAVIASVQSRVALWYGFAVQAVEEWEVEAKRLVADYSDADASVDALPVAFAFVQAVGKHLPGMGTAMGVIEDVGNLAGVVRAYMGNAPMTMAGARARLTAAIDEVKLATGSGLRDAVHGYETRVRDRLSPENPSSPLLGVEWGSDEPSYIDSLVDWLGVPQPTEANTTAPIKKEMHEAFEKVMWEVNRELQRS